MSSPLESLQPQSLWRHFDAIRMIPRGSGKEAAIREHMKRFAAQHSFKVREDAAGNVCISVPATRGHESAPTVVLQGHMDMVCEKNAGTSFDFDRDPIRVVVEGDWVRADGTTLGADNGLGLAAAMAAATDESAVHGPLELFFTVDEETGLTGAMSLDPSLLSGRRLLNLDSEEDGALFVGCAGGCNTAIRLPIKRTKPRSAFGLAIHVTGLRGGHSGLNIVDNRGNSIKLLNRALLALLAEIDLGLASIQGGNKHNAIPREAQAVCVVRRADRAKAREIVARALQAARTEFASAEPALSMEVVTVDPPESVLARPSRDTLVRLIAALPHGVLSMSRDISGLVETSSNLATTRTEADAVHLLTSSRSSVAAALTATLEQVGAACELAGATAERQGGYPGWQPNMDSQLLALGRKVFTEIWGREPKVTAIHAGLECGLIGERVGGMDMLSFGPQLESVHSPDERAQVSSTARFWEALKAMLRNLA